MYDESTRLCDVKYKIVFLGASGVGKSAVIERFVHQTYDDYRGVHHDSYSKQSELIFL